MTVLSKTSVYILLKFGGGILYDRVASAEQYSSMEVFAAEILSDNFRWFRSSSIAIRSLQIVVDPPIGGFSGSFTRSKVTFLICFGFSEGMHTIMPYSEFRDIRNSSACPPSGRSSVARNTDSGSLKYLSVVTFRRTGTIGGVPNVSPAAIIVSIITLVVFCRKAG